MSCCVVDTATPEPREKPGNERFTLGMAGADRGSDEPECLIEPLLDNCDPETWLDDEPSPIDCD